MTPMRDDLGLVLTGATAPAHEHYRRALAGLQTFTGDPVAALGLALDEAPDFAMAYALKGYLYALSTEAAAMPVARDATEKLAASAATSRERAHAAALGALVEGRWNEAGRLLGMLTAAEPRDVLALQAGHQIDFFTGNSTSLRDRIAAALPAWQAGMPGYHAMLAAHAFGLEETGDYRAAEEAGRRAIELQPRDGWAQHAVAHVMEMQSRQDEGIAWMRGNEANWTTDSFLKIHNWWHLSLYHFDLGEHTAVLELYDRHVFGEAGEVVLNLLDASALLWRLHLAGAPTGDRFAVLAARWAPFAQSGNYAFNDAHAMMAFAGAGRAAEMDLLVATQREAAARGGDNAAHTRDIGLPATLGIRAFAEGDYRETVRLLAPIVAIAHRFGGSHAQRDVLDLTLIEAAIRAGDAALAGRLATARKSAREASPLSGLFVERAGRLTDSSLSP